MLDLIGEILLEQQVEVGLDLLPGAGLYALQIQISAFLAVDETTLDKFQAQFVVLEPESFAGSALLQGD